MKAHVLFDEKGAIHGVMFPPSPAQGKATPLDKPAVSLRPQQDQLHATLEIPAGLQHLKPRELHSAARVEGAGASAHLVPAK